MGKKKLYEEKKMKANKPEEISNENHGQSEVAEVSVEKNMGPSIMDFIRRMRENKEKETEKKENNEKKNETIDDENITSTQNLISDARARRNEGVKTFQCDKCEFKSGSKTLLKRHIDSMHKKGDHPCNQCEQMMSSETNLKKHIESSHEQKNPTGKTSKYVKKRIQCNKCDKKFNKEENFKRHVKTHHVETITSSVSELPNAIQCSK